MATRRAVLFQFFGLGALLFAVSRWLPAADPAPIEIGLAELADIRAEGIALFGRPPAGQELAALVEARVADEILYRRALARGLDREDRSVRRRLVRNLAFLRAHPDAPPAPDVEESLYREALALGMDRTDSVVRRKLVQRAKLEIETAARTPEPTESELRAWLAAHPERAAGPRRVRFRHLFFDPARRGARAEPDARAILAAAQLREPPAVADPCLLSGDQPLQAEATAARQLGPGFAAALFDAPVGSWSGPLRSSLGWHLVFVDEHTSPAALPFESLRAAARDAVLEARGVAALSRFLTEQRARYRVTVAEGSPTGGP